MGSIPQAAIDILPFSAEPMAQWNEDTDILTFAKAFYPQSLSFGIKAFYLEKKDMQKLAGSFTKNLMEAYNAPIDLDFYDDECFGQVAKYAIAIKRCIHSLLEDAGFYSLAHVLETESDMECSLLLASNFYYKQSAQMLRNILEEVLLPIHFCDTIQDFDAWKANSYRTPKLRGNDGLIKRLVKENIISALLASRIANLYGNLSAYVHGSQNSFIHHNIHLGEIHLVEFNEERFSAWSELFCECTEISLHLLKINYDQWSIIRSFKFETLAKIGKTFCHTCHNEDAFDRWLLPSKYCFIAQNAIDQGSFNLIGTNEISFYHYICQRCGNSITVNANETHLSVVYCFSDDDLPSGSSITDYAELVRGTENPYCEWYTVQEIGKDFVTPLLVHLDT